MTVEFAREEVLNALQDWRMVEDFCQGARAVKDKGTDYLPMPNPDDLSPRNVLRYNQYAQRAVYYGVPGRTLDGLVGQVFSRLPTVEFPETSIWERQFANMDGRGVTIGQQSIDVLSRCLKFGRLGMLADFPLNEGNVSAADTQLPEVTVYQPWDIPNWRDITVDGKRQLRMVVLREVVEKDGEDEFTLTYVPLWRVFRLKGGVVQVTIHSGDNPVPIKGPFVLRGAKGVPLKEIPFTFVGSLNNDSTVDKSPLLDLVEIVRGHYCNSADAQESSFLCGQPSPVVTGVTEEWAQNILSQNKLQLGSRNWTPFPKDAKASLLQAAPNLLPLELMKQAEAQMIALGARLVEQRAQPRTLGEARIEELSELSVLGRCSFNVNQAYKKIIEWCGAYLGTPVDKVVYELQADPDVTRLTPEMAKAVSELWVKGLIVHEEARSAVREIAYLPDDEAKEIAAQEEEEKMQAAVAAQKAMTEASGDPEGDAPPDDSPPADDE